MGLSEFGALFNQFETARLRHVSFLLNLSPRRNLYSMMKKLSKNLGISEELAQDWIDRHEEIGPLDFLTWSSSQERSNTG